MLTDFAKNSARSLLNSGLAAAYYTINGVENSAALTKRWITEDKVHLTFRADRTDDGSTISKITIKDASGNAVAEINKNIVISSDSYVFDFTYELKYLQGGVEV